MEVKEKGGLPFLPSLSTWVRVALLVWRSKFLVVRFLSLFLFLYIELGKY